MPDAPPFLASAGSMPDRIGNVPARELWPGLILKIHHLPFR